MKTGSINYIAYHEKPEKIFNQCEIAPYLQHIVTNQPYYKEGWLRKWIEGRQIASYKGIGIIKRLHSCRVSKLTDITNSRFLEAFLHTSADLFCKNFPVNIWVKSRFPHDVFPSPMSVISKINSESTHIGKYYRVCGTKTMIVQHVELISIFKYLFFAGLYAASIPHNDPAKFSMSSLYDSTLSMIHPVVAAGSNRCEAFKSFFGITYEQMQEKNKSNFHEVLNIDLITKNGNVKYNLTATNRINRLMAHAQTIVILVHGFMESSEGWMVNAIAPELLKKPELKVFALDGRKVINLEYFRSSTNVRFMGELLGMFLADVIKGGQDPSKIYIVGHSLGSHIAGVAGKKVHELTGKLIGRITALDPAGPCFSNVSANGRLDKTDAEYVDVIHSNGGFLGLKEPVGHKDFYPNGGISQPGCYISICDHSRAWELYAESIVSPKHFPARRCGNWTMFGDGLCSENEISYMGIQSDNKNPGFYFLTTKNSAPFGMGSAGSG